jgi:hypothetical protein
LIGRRGRDVRAGGKVIGVHRANQIRPLDQHLCRPKRIAQIGAAALEFGRERSVEDRNGPACEQRRDRIVGS